MEALQFLNVSKSYRKGITSKNVIALQDVTFSVPGTGITGFVGPNGAGKTTCIKIALGLIRQFRGEVRVGGVIGSDPRARNNIAYVSELPYLYPYLTVKEHVVFFHRLMDLDDKTESDTVLRLLERVELSSVIDRKVRELSKGMQQRLNIAQALLGDPHFLIMDEPMSGLDPLGRRMVRTLLEELSAEGKAVFFSTHVLEDIESLCDRVIALHEGKVVYNGNLETLSDRGSAGVDIEIPTISEALHAQLLRQGCTIRKISLGGLKLEVRSTDALESCRRLLLDNNILPTTITPRTVPLEKILYPKSGRMEAS